MIRIIHLSDLHLESENLSYEKRSIIKALSEDLKSFVNDATLLFFTGDLLDKGGKDFTDKNNSFKKFEELFINQIIQENPILNGRIFLVPGNHDVIRNKIDPITEAGLKASLTDAKSLNSFIINNRDKSLHLDRISDYKIWEKEFYKKHNKVDATNFDNSFKVVLKDYKVGITCLNSAWLCKDDTDKENILLGKNQIENSIEQLNDCQIKLALCHHPMEFFREFDRESSKLELYKNYDILFTGHVHELASTYTQELFGNIFISIANSTIGDNPKERRYVNGYTIIDLFPGERIKATYRKYIEQHKKFVPNTDIGTEDGCKMFQILKDDKLERFEHNLSLVSSIESRFREKLDDLIIMAEGTTNIDHSIDTLFVEPAILNCPQRSLSEEETKKYTIESILGDSLNYLIYGLKESGKTVLLAKMFTESIQRFNTFNRIPVFIKFNEIKNKDIKKVLREYLSISSDKINEFIKNTNIILFVDDIQFTSKGLEQVLTFKNAVSDYPNIKLVATSSQILENVIPTEYLAYNDVFRFNIAFIQSFSSKEIKELITKWFIGKEIDLQENMERLIKNFADFGLPKTPLSVTLFLWIFDKQEKRPINNSVLVEMFIENLLEKTNLENIYSGTFDFKNKQRLLSFIAKYMRDKGDEDNNYCVDYVELLSFVNNYLKTRFSGKPQKVLDDLIARGIFLYEGENMLRFKSAFFFHYFLSLYFDHDSEFKQFVFSDENYLDYIDEIGYYTGLKRDAIDILTFTQEKLLYAFGDFNTDVRENFSKVDDVLETKTKEETFAYSIDESKVASKPTDLEIEEMYDEKLSSIPVQKNIPKKQVTDLDTKKNLDKILQLSATVLKNSEDVDSFEAKVISYANVLISSISFLMQYRDSVISYFNEYKKQPEHFPKNIDMNLFIRILPLMHQVVIFEWLGSQKLRPVIEDKIEKDKRSTNTSDYERFLSTFIYSDIKGADYPEKINTFAKNTDFNYLKDLTILKVMSYYHLRKNTEELDKFYLKLMSELKEELGQIDKREKTQYMKQIKDKKKKNQ